MKTDETLIGPLLRYFFLDFLCTQKRASPQTIVSYRDAFRLLLEFVHEKQGIAPEAMQVKDLSVTVILSFLDHLELKRGNSVRSRNVRLAAIRSFFRVVALRDPASVNQSTCVLAIPVKRADRLLVKSLSRDEIDAIIAASDLTRWSGRRDHALLLTLYNSGARASEITALKQSQVVFGTSNFLHLFGKGRKERTVPLWPKTAAALKAWFAEIADWDTDLAYPSAANNRLTREGLNYILQRAIMRASSNCQSLREKKVTPHSVRHTTATHLLQSGVDISVIALWLGHESIETTHIYLESDLATKETALSKLSPAGVDVPRFKADDKILAFLAAL
ncbi:tyrosine-type recombinase/integrase [bacterium]|nr:tyrosine-type recombinase/integrase [bacterium]